MIRGSGKRNGCACFGSVGSSFSELRSIGLLVSTLVAFLIPKSYISTTQLMPPDPQSTSGMAMMAAMAAKGGGGLAGVAGDLLGLKSSGALFIGVSAEPDFTGPPNTAV